MIRKMNELKVLCNHDASRTVYSALIRIIKKRRYRYVRSRGLPLFVIKSIGVHLGGFY
jgi:hypothetical protein